MIIEPIDLVAIREMAEERFGDMVKGVVDIERRLMALGAALHAESRSVEDPTIQATIRKIVATLVRADG